MSMSSWVKGLRSPSEEWKKKRAAVQALVDAGEPVPASLIEYFGEKGVDPKYILRDETRGLEVKVPCSKGSDDSSQWIEVVIKDLPFGVERIRFINSW